MKIKKILLGILGFLLVLSAGFVVWASFPYQAGETAQAALQSSADVRVDTSRWIVFEPLGSDPEIGIIFYPGGRVEPEAYAPLLQNLAAAGYLVVDVPMPLDLAVFGLDKAEAVKAAYPQIKTWVLAGHSLGGAMAANYLYENPDAARALILWGSYPAESNDLSQSGLEVLSIYGSEDSGAAEIAASQERLPGNALFMLIQGGNHAQFGDYGEQKGDGQALIPAVDQRELALQSMLDFLDKLEN